MKFKLSMLFILLVKFSFGQMTSEMIASIADKSVVLILSYDKFNQPKGQGSGVVIGNNGIIITNYHVYKGGTMVVKSGKNTYYAEQILASNPQMDYLIFEIGVSLPAIRIGNSSDLKKGEQVYAMGSPSGLENTFTSGMFSSISSITTKYGNQNHIQHNASISEGSSGGALLNSRAELVGINSLYVFGKNLSFTIPINDIMDEIRNQPFYNSINSQQNGGNYYGNYQNMRPAPDSRGYYSQPDGYRYYQQPDGYRYYPEINPMPPGYLTPDGQPYNNNQPYDYGKGGNGSKSGWEKFEKGVDKFFEWGNKGVDLLNRAVPIYPNQNYQAPRGGTQYSPYIGDPERYGGGSGYTYPQTPAQPTPQFTPRDGNPVQPEYIRRW